MRFLAAIGLLLILTVGVVDAQATDGLITSQNTTLFTGPGPSYEEVGQLSIAQPFTVQARSQVGNWVRIIHTDDSSIAGWAQTGHLPLAVNEFELSSVPAINTPDADMERANLQFTPAILFETPVLPANINTERLREIYETGQELGNDPFAVAKVGDCNTASGYFLQPISVGQFDIGPYDYLSDTVDAYGESFQRRSIASRDGFNVSSIFDPLWAMGADCNPNEPPLLCEYRHNPATVAFLMFGQNDILVLTRDQYREFLTEAVERSIERGVIPVLSTFTNRPENTEKWGQIMAMNTITIEVADEYDVPLINFWLAAHSLPSYGIGNDYAHLTQGGVGVTFTGREAEYGITLYNLVVLNMLDTIYHDIIEPEDV